MEEIVSVVEGGEVRDVEDGGIRSRADRMRGLQEGLLTELRSLPPRNQSEIEQNVLGSWNVFSTDPEEICDWKVLAAVHGVFLCTSVFCNSFQIFNRILGYKRYIIVGLSLFYFYAILAFFICWYLLQKEKVPIKIYKFDVLNILLSFVVIMILNAPGAYLAVSEKYIYDPSVSAAFLAFTDLVCLFMLASIINMLCHKVINSILYDEENFQVYEPALTNQCCTAIRNVVRTPEFTRIPAQDNVWFMYFVSALNLVLLYGLNFCCSVVIWIGDNEWAPYALTLQLCNLAAGKRMLDISARTHKDPVMDCFLLGVNGKIGSSVGQLFWAIINIIGFYVIW